MGRRIIDGRTQHQRIQRRRALGTLRSLVIKPSTIVRYEKAFRLFLAFLLSQKVALAHNLLVLDDQVQCYLENLWEDGESLSLAGDTLSSLQYFQPSCKRNLPGSWKLLKTWQVHELPSRAPPFTWPTLLVFLGKLHSISPSAALGVHLAFRTLLRTGELLALQSKDIVIGPTGANAILHLGLTKTGVHNPAAGSVTLTDMQLVQRLSKWKSTLKYSTPLIPWSGPKFRSIFHQCCQECQLSSYHYKPYSLRRGGATDLWISSQNYSLVAHTGRWTSEKTLRVYVQESIAMLTSFHFRPSPKQRDWQLYYIQASRVEHPQMRRSRGRGRR